MGISITDIGQFGSKAGAKSPFEGDLENENMSMVEKNLSGMHQT